MKAPEIITGVEDRFHYEISDACIMCGICENHCPVYAISESQTKYKISPDKCIDCGTCAAICPVGAAASPNLIRESIDMEKIDTERCYFNAGCAMNYYKPDLPEAMLELLRNNWGDVKLHKNCCRHDPGLDKGSTIINNCAGCDRRFRSLYEGINTISIWEILASIPNLNLPDYGGKAMSVHDSCGYRHKPQVHRAIRILLSRMNITVVEAKCHGMNSVCCGDNFFGTMQDEMVAERIRMRADQMPCEDVVVYCIGCVRSMFSGGKTPHYLPDLLLNRTTEQMDDTLNSYHHNLEEYIKAH